MTDREQQVLEILQRNPLIPQQELADQIGISRSAVAGHIMQLTRKGFIKGKGYILCSEPYAVVLGGANMDLCGRSDASIVLADSNPGSFESSAGGVGRNIAENLARLGSQVEFIGTFGGDSWGEELKESCHLSNVGTDHSLILPDRKSSSYLSIIDDQGELLVALNDMQLIESLNAKQLAKRRGIITGASVLVIDANLSEEALEYLFNQYGNKTIFADPVSSIKATKLLPYLDKIDFLKPNQLEAQVLSGHSINESIEVSQLADDLHEKGVKHLAISLGNKGVLASCNSQQTLMDATPTHVVNVTGAGDAMMAALVHAYLQNWSWDQSIRFAIAASHLALTSVDTINSEMSEQTLLSLIEEK
ncbi:PfkB family carbohydrate kinase [Vibrio sp. RC27]